jgi:inward rectifier potassium channel
MLNPKPHRMRQPIAVGGLEFRLAKEGVARFDFRDPYYLAVSLSWPAFTVAMLFCWLAINVAFAWLYWLSPGDVTNAAPGSFADVFFFSTETLATVGYGVMAPATLYGHIVSAVEIVTGMAFTAIFTGLLFVRFSRAKAKILFSEDAVVTMHNGRRALMARAVNGRLTIMSNASARLFLLLVEQTEEGVSYRRLHDLPLQRSHQPLFVVPWTVIHVIDEASPLDKYDAERLAHSDAFLILTIETRDHALSALVHEIKSYRPDHIRFGMRFAETVRQDETGQAIADLSRIGMLEPDNGTIPSP